MSIPDKKSICRHRCLRDTLCKVMKKKPNHRFNFAYLSNWREALFSSSSMPVIFGSPENSPIIHVWVTWRYLRAPPFLRHQEATKRIKNHTHLLSKHHAYCTQAFFKNALQIIQRWTLTLVHLKNLAGFPRENLCH